MIWMIGKSAPSVSLLILRNCEEFDTPDGCSLSEGPWQAVEMGQQQPHEAASLTEPKEQN